MRNEVRIGRQPNDEHRATLGVVLAGDLAAMVLNHAVDRAEAQARSFADRLGRIEGSKTRCGSRMPGPLSENCNTISGLRRRARYLERSTADFFQCVHRVLDDFDESPERTGWHCHARWENPGP